MFVRFRVARLLVGVDQPVAAALDLVERRRAPRLVEARLQKSRPVVRQHAVQRAHDVVETVGDGDIAAAVYTEKRTREVVERFRAAGLLPDERVRIEPDQGALPVIILAALPAPPRNWPPHRGDRIIGGVLERPPSEASAFVECGSVVRYRVKSLRLRP